MREGNGHHDGVLRYVGVPLGCGAPEAHGVGGFARRGRGEVTVYVVEEAR